MIVNVLKYCTHLFFEQDVALTGYNTTGPLRAALW